MLKQVTSITGNNSETNNIYRVYLARKVLEGEDFVLINSDVLLHPRILRTLIKSDREGIVLSVDMKVKLGEEEMKR